MRRALGPGVDTVCLSIPRGNGKSTLAAHVLTRCLTPGDPLHVPAAEYLLCAASIEQARIVFRFVQADLEPTGEYRFLDSATRIGITHAASNTRLRVLSSNANTAMGIVNCPPLGFADWTAPAGRETRVLMLIEAGTTELYREGQHGSLIDSSAALFDEELTGDIRVNRVRWSRNKLTLNRPGTGAFSGQFEATDPSLGDGQWHV